MMIALRDIKIVINKKYVVFGFVFGVLGILSPVFLPQYGVFLSILFFALSYFIAIYTNSFQKDFEGKFEDRMKMTDTVGMAIKHKGGKPQLVVNQ